MRITNRRDFLSMAWLFFFPLIRTNHIKNLPYASMTNGHWPLPTMGINKLKSYLRLLCYSPPALQLSSQSSPGPTTRIGTYNVKNCSNNQTMLRVNLQIPTRPTPIKWRDNRNKVPTERNEKKKTSNWESQAMAMAHKKGVNANKSNLATNHQTIIMALVSVRGHHNHIWPPPQRIYGLQSRVIWTRSRNILSI